MTKCIECHNQFEVTIDERTFFSALDIPLPEQCPTCRSRQRMSFRNERTLYARNCDLCKKHIISIYSDGALFPVYCTECFWSDAWDPKKYGRAVNTGEPFFPQLKNLMDCVPRLGIINKQSTNSEYCNYAFENKNCYLTFGSHREEDCLYSHYSTHNRNQLDALWTYENELCYECSFTIKSFRCIGLRHCDDCMECAFSFDLKDCKHCLFSSNLRHKEYHIFNIPYSKEEYEKKLAAYSLHTASGFTRAFDIFQNDVLGKFPTRAYYQIACENCEGNNHHHSRNLTFCFNATKCENVRYGFQMDAVIDSQDQNYMGYDPSERCYQTIGCTGVYSCQFCDSCWINSMLTYCSYCFSSQDCFGCISLNKGAYCILNMPYDKDTYNSLVGKIKETMKRTGEWGRFLPREDSPFGYNESVASESYPLMRDDALQAGFHWKDNLPFTSGKETITWSDIPDSIHYCKPTHLEGVVVACAQCQRNYKLTKRELEFYCVVSVPIPRSCPACRYLRRLDNEKGSQLNNRQCQCDRAHPSHSNGRCEHSFKTIYAPDRPEIIYCDECYNAETL